MRILVIDTETTGTDHATDCVIEFAAVALDTDTGELDGNSVLVRPTIPIPPEASAIHHLTDADFANAAGSLELGVVEVLWMVTGCEPRHDVDDFPVDAYAAHHAPFDRGFVEHLLPPRPWLDTVRIARRYVPEMPSHGNQYLRYALKLDVELESSGWLAPHRAEGDATVTAALLRYMLSGPAAADFAGLGLAGFVAKVDSPILLDVVGFGQHRGQKWAAVPYRFLQWVRDNMETPDPDVLFTVQHYLANYQPKLLDVVGFGKYRGAPWANVPSDYLAWLNRNNDGADPDVVHTVRHYLGPR
jgi:exodeoxyribonuclease X